MIESAKMIKSLVSREGYKMKDFLCIFSKKMGKKYSSTSFSNRLHGGTIRLEEFLVIADILGYEIKLEKK